MKVKNILPIAVVGGAIFLLTKKTKAEAEVLPTAKELLPKAIENSELDLTKKAYDDLCYLIQDFLYSNANIESLPGFDGAIDNWIEMYGFLVPPVSLTVKGTLAVKRWMDTQLMEKIGEKKVIPLKQIYTLGIMVEIHGITTGYSLIEASAQWNNTAINAARNTIEDAGIAILTEEIIEPGLHLGTCNFTVVGTPEEIKGICYPDNLIVIYSYTYHTKKGHYYDYILYYPYVPHGLGSL